MKDKSVTNNTLQWYSHCWIGEFECTAVGNQIKFQHPSIAVIKFKDRAFEFIFANSEKGKQARWLCQNAEEQATWIRLQRFNKNKCIEFQIVGGECSCMQKEGICLIWMSVVSAYGLTPNGWFCEDKKLNQTWYWTRFECSRDVESKTKSVILIIQRFLRHR